MAGRAGLGATVVAIGALVGAVVAFTSAGTGLELCGTDPHCAALARSFALRTGFLVGAVTVLMQLTVAGMLRMVVLEERRRVELEVLTTRGGAALGVRRG